MSARLTSSIGRSPRSWASSRTLPGLRVARTTRRLEREGPLATRVERTPLQRDEAMDTGAGQREQRIETRAVERRLLRRPLHFDELSGTGHHHVHVHGGAGVLDVIEVEHRDTADDADAHGGHAIAHGRAGARFTERIGDGDEAAGDRGRPRAAVGLNDVAVDPHRALAHLGAVDDRPERAANQPPNLLPPAPPPPLLAPP